MRNASILGAIAVIGVAGSAMAQSDEDRAYQSELFADAQSRTSLLVDDTGTAGFGENGFFINSAQGDFTLNLGGTLQFRYFYNDGNSNTNETTGFDLGETSIHAGGTVHGGLLNYYIEADFSNDGGSAFLDEAWVSFPVNDTLAFRVGQFYDPFLREDIVVEENALAVDRSVVNYAFGTANVQGIDLTYQDGSFRLAGAFTDGGNSANSAWGTESADYGLSGRVDFLTIGDNWAQFDDWTSERGEEAGLLLGGAVHYETGGETNGTVDSDLFQYTVDASFEVNGLNLAAIGVVTDSSSAGGNFDDYGYVFQGGYRIIENGEIFGRYEGIIADDNRGLENDHFTFVTAGYNHFLAGQSARVTVDALIPLDDTEGLDTFGNFNNLGLLGNNEDFVIRVQFQLAF